MQPSALALALLLSLAAARAVADDAPPPPPPQRQRASPRGFLPARPGRSSGAGRIPPPPPGSQPRQPAGPLPRLLPEKDGGGAGTGAAETFRDASGGVHPNRVCDEPSWPVHNHFCSYQDEPVRHVWPYVNQGREWYSDGAPFNASEAGFWEACPASPSAPPGGGGCRDLDLTDRGLESCLDLCSEAFQQGEACSRDGAACGPGLFCTYEFENGEGEEDGGGGGGGGGVCEACPSSPEECLSSGIGSELGIESCLQCEVKCYYLKWGEMYVDGANDEGPTNIMANGMGSSPFYSPPGSAYAPLVDCSDMVLDGVDTCPGANNSICLVEEYAKDTFYYELAWNCEKSGGLALVMFTDNSASGKSTNLPTDAYLAAEVNIPAVSIAYDDGKFLRQEKLGTWANVSVVDVGWDDCWIDQACSTTIPCLGSMADGFCLFVDGTDEGLWCDSCPEDPYECFFPVEGSPRVQNEVESCAASCAASIQFGENCKLCGETVTGFEFGVEDQSDRCYFCPEQDLKYPERAVPLFSGKDREVKCWQVQSFFDRVDVPSDSKNCRLAQLQNYVCGCEGTGYAGASTQAQKTALVWGPRVTAILSFLGSAYVFYDSLRLKERRSKVFYQLMVELSAFDMIGSFAYAFTSLPIPSEYFFLGSRGNGATCTTQGFFIQVGTISCYTNVSLAAYYFLVIKKGASESALQKVRLWLFICPIMVGMAFAFAGIPFYDNVILWCNNAASWWPDIPVAIAILIATVVMGLVCVDVYKKENASKKWRGSEARNTLSTKVFWQSFWFLMAFYATWPPYLALQYAWASGKAFDHYGFILFAGLVVPLQGLWNFFVYARTRSLKGVTDRLSTAVSQRINSMVSSVSRRRSRRSSAGSEKGTENETTQSQTITKNETTASAAMNSRAEKN